MSEETSREQTIDDRAARVLDALDDGPDGAPGDTGQEAKEAAKPPKGDDASAAIAPPVSWSSEDKAAFARLPREAQEVVARREGERDRFLSQRTQAVAQKERALEEQRHSYAQHLDAFIEQAKTFDPILGEGAQTDWAKLARENPSAYVQKMAAFQQRVQQLRTAHHERQRIADETNRVVATRELGTFLGESGFSPQEVGGLTDHRAYLIALDAMRYRKLMRGQKETAAKKVVTASKVQRPGAARDGEPVSARLTTLKRAARTSGKLDDRAAYVLAALREA
jgi:hypothetical protein